MNNIINEVVSGCFCYSLTLKNKYGDDIRNLNRLEAEKFFRNHGAIYDAEHNYWYDTDDIIKSIEDKKIIDVIKDLENQDYYNNYVFYDELNEAIKDTENPDLLKAYKLIIDEIDSIDRRCKYFLDSNFVVEPKSSASKEINTRNNLKIIAKLIKEHRESLKK